MMRWASQQPHDRKVYAGATMVSQPSPTMRLSQGTEVSDEQLAQVTLSTVATASSFLPAARHLWRRRTSHCRSVAIRWRLGRIAIAGDAPDRARYHLMPGESFVRSLLRVRATGASRRIRTVGRLRAARRARRAGHAPRVHVPVDAGHRSFVE